ncbi:hypothetical protein [Bradyrhizobium sp. B120]|uniref:hypothetical protein n=1 Tax=Bradyrhizobium sp. B120 TaxID=3410088 RepID=UPI003B980400
MIPDRLAKLKFIAEDMQFAFHMASQVTDPFLTRTIARHVLIRAENFIEHARGLRRPLQDAGFDMNAFRQATRAYAAAFEEYFTLARHRLGAHVQDFDFGKRIELWNEIEIVKVSYFVDGARQLYESLAALGVPGYVAYADPPEISDPRVVDTLLHIQRTLDARTWVEMGTDALAMTRGNTAAVLNMTPVHSRAGQLALIRRWIILQLDLIEKFAAFPAITRIFKARIITDIVSFCDCLVTRPVAPDAPQAMDGLDKLVQAEGQSSAPIDSFVAASHFETELDATRAVRNKIGAHLESDDAHPLATLLSDLDRFDLAKALAFYRRCAAAFHKLCFTVHFLRMYAADGSRLYGVSMSHSSVQPFAGTNAALPPAPPEPPKVNDEEEYRKNLTLWIDGDENQKGTARSFFWNAFLGSDAVETIDETERLGFSARYGSHPFRKAHAFVLQALNDNLSDVDFKGVLDLLLNNRSGAPYPLAELLVRYGQNATPFRRYLICHVLGEIGSAPHESVSAFLEAYSRSPIWGIRLEASLARYKTFVKDEGFYRINHRGQSRAEHDDLVAAITRTMTPDEQLICLLSFASHLSGPNLGSFAKPFEANYTAMKSEIEALCMPYLHDDPAMAKATLLKQLIDTNDYVGIGIHLALNFEDGEKHRLYDAVVRSCCDGTIKDAGHDQATRHLAMAFILKKEHRYALDIAEPLASRNPEWIDVQILVAQILGQMEGSETGAKERVSTIRSAYKLSPTQEALLTVVEAEITQRASS